ncbi:deleted in malignant brain tumors 1 protein-like, partial [Saccostrea cucullata]|uniref:deleted in malignant brain tumors 1 protein-like n=1 Tax=Saccostrea cuccullata TaxID=36930 RepID=UPI002ED69EAD
MDDYAVRLSDGQYDRGRVEISVGGTWGSISSSSVWPSGKNAQVICTQLGFQSGEAITNGTYLQGRGPVWIRDLNCTGHETSIRDCSFTISGTDLYSRSSPDIGVICLRPLFTPTSSTKTSKSSQTSQDDISTTEAVVTTHTSSEGNKEETYTDETGHVRQIITEVVQEKTGMIVANCLAALALAILIVMMVCWKLRNTFKKGRGNPLKSKFRGGKDFRGKKPTLKDWFSWIESTIDGFFHMKEDD